MKPSRRQFVTAFAAVPALPLLGAAAAQETGVKEAPQEQGKGRTVPKLQATVVLVRHTEKDTNDRRDPDLSKAGRERAEDLARMFGAAGVTGLIHSEFKRTRDTLAPLAKVTGAGMEVIAAADHARLIERLSSAGPDEVLVVAGHSNTMPQAAWALGAELPDLDNTAKVDFGGFLPHDAYDRVHVLTPGTKAARLMELRYGKPSPEPKK